MRERLATWLRKNSQKKIFLLRHGTIEAESGEKCYIGQADLPLSDTGKAQATYWQSCLASVPLESIITSDLARCQETASIVAGGNGDLETIAELREIDLGQWEQKRVSEVKTRWPDAYRQRGLDLAGFRPPGGECFLDLKKRVVPAFDAAVEKSSSPVLIVTHAGVIRMILCHILGMPVENLFRIALGYGAMTLIDLHDTGYQVQAMNLLPDER